jgi:hypothetical protein
MTSNPELLHYQEQVKKLLSAKSQRLDEIKEINRRLSIMGINNTTQASTTTSNISVAPKSSESSVKKISVKKSVDTTVKSESTTSGQIKIVATVEDMRTFLKSKGIDYPSQAKKAELEKIVRNNFLVKKVNAFHQKKT